MVYNGISMETIGISVIPIGLLLFFFNRFAVCVVKSNMEISKVK